MNEYIVEIRSGCEIDATRVYFIIAKNEVDARARVFDDGVLISDTISYAGSGNAIMRANDIRYVDSNRIAVGNYSHITDAQWASLPNKSEAKKIAIELMCEERDANGKNLPSLIFKNGWRMITLVNLDKWVMLDTNGNKIVGIEWT